MTAAVVVPFRERFTTCASCRSEARFAVAPASDPSKFTTACQRHLDTWRRRIEAADPQPSLLDVAAMHVERADPWWRSTADKAVETLAGGFRPFTVDDVRDLGVAEPDHPNRWGGLFGAHARRGSIRRTGQMLPSRHPLRNGSLVPEWIGCAA